MLRNAKARQATYMRAMRRTEDQITPVLKAFHDQVLFLKHNLNARAIGSLKNTSAGLQSDVADLVQSIDASSQEADSSSHLSPPRTATNSLPRKQVYSAIPNCEESMTTSVTAPVTPERIMQFAWGYVPPLVLEAAVHHRIFDLLDAGPKTISEVQKETGASERGLTAVMNALVGMNFLAKISRGSFHSHPKVPRFWSVPNPAFKVDSFVRQRA